MKRLLLAIVAALAAACADHSATQYVGTVTHEDAPESEGSLRLTLFSRTDTSFSGVIELGAPARGTGSALAWHEGPELHVVTVGAQSGDTILWISRLSDEGLGGKFEVTGGDRAGQQGTWRARLVNGPPATPAALRSPAPPPVPPVTALWPLLILLTDGGRPLTVDPTNAADRDRRRVVTPASLTSLRHQRMARAVHDRAVDQHPHVAHATS